ncbi:hypothetical protein TIFTF001_022028 [Ficus carica]|uniref:Uncharacterized protein n=1 Tax=Ficus carica TaxID=3494 RepID=A0AA88AIK9_FICCA|nr:hypothetical protein TIFTF001_022028 [Ficus carica]
MLKSSCIVFIHRSWKDTSSQTYCGLYSTLFSAAAIHPVLGYMSKYGLRSSKISVNNTTTSTQKRQEYGFVVGDKTEHCHSE